MSTPMLQIMLWVGAGSALGGCARVMVAVLMLQLLGDDFPYGVITVNVLGSFLIGLVAAATGPESRWQLSQGRRQFLLAGVCGGFTTFSFYSLQTMLLLQSGELSRALSYIMATIALSLGGVWCGFLIGRRWR